MGQSPKGEYLPSKQDEQVIAKVMGMFQLSHDSREAVVQEWREAEALYHGHHWENVNMPEFRNKLTIDLIGSSIDTMIPILNSQPPKLDVMAVGNDPVDYAMSETLQAVMDEFWQLRDMQNLISELLLDYLVYGTGLLKVTYNQYDDLPDCDVVDPFTFFVNPSATKLENAEWVIYASPMPLYEVRRMYPDEGQFVRSDNDLAEYRAHKTQGQTSSDHPIAIENSAGQTNLYKAKSQAYADQEESVLFIECYIRDNSKNHMASAEDGAPEDEDNKKDIEGVRKVCIAGNVLLFDGESKYPFFTQSNHISHPFPFIHMKNMGSAHQFWGRPEPKRLKHLNLAMDRIASQVMDNVHLMANPMWVVDQTADVQDQIHNKPGQIIRKRGAGQVTMQSPASMPSYVFNLYNLLLDMFETVSGVNKATQGKADTNVTSGIQAQIYQKASSSKIDYKARSVEMALQNLGQLWLTMFKQLGTKWINIPFQHSTGKMEYREVMGLLFKNKDIMVRTRLGSTLPENRQFQENKIMQLAQMGIITDPEYIIQNLNMPQKESLIKRMAEQKAEQEAQMEKMAQEMSQQAPDITAKFGRNKDEMMANLKKNPELIAEAQDLLKN